VVELIALARNRVFEQHGVVLKPEIEVLGRVPGWDVQSGE
jgi:UDP-N-acetylenolpyruvoylglucosamine reductase